MKKIKISISVNSIYFSFTNQGNDDNLNQTSYIETGNLIFEYDYFTKNHKLMSSFIKDITNQTKIEKVKIKSLELVPIVLKILKTNINIKKLYILDNKTLDTNAFLTIIDNKNINYLNCYNMPGVMFNYINQRKDILIELRNEIGFNSNFMTTNKLNKYSTIFYKRYITIDNNLTENDLRDLDAFLLINDNLQSINLKKYDLTTFNQIYKLLQKYNKEKITIKIFQTKDNIDNIYNDINELKKLKNKNIKIKVIYEKDYIFKNFFKQINLSMIRFSFLIIFITLLLFSGITKYTSAKEETETTEIVDDIQNIVQDLEEEYLDDVQELYEAGIIDEEELESQTNDSTASNKPTAYLTKYEKVFSKLKEINSDTVGWLTVKNTKVDYPVVQYTDNDYYLKRSFDNKKNSRGWIFADYRNSFTEFDDNTIIYGHNLKSGYMFGTLQKVLEPSWYENKDNRKIIFNTELGNYNWEIFSIYTMEKQNDYLVSTFANENNFNNYIKLSKQRSIIDFGVDVKYGDNILTLSTCYKDSNHRLIIQAKLIK